jgi:hypothetical protein
MLTRRGRRLVPGVRALRYPHEVEANEVHGAKPQSSAVDEFDSDGKRLVQNRRVSDRLGSFSYTGMADHRER